MLALRYIYVTGGVELMERTGLLKFCPRWLGDRKDLITLGGKKTNDNKFWQDTTRDLFNGDIKKIVV